MLKFIAYSLIILLLSISNSYSQDGPIVPCVGCDSMVEAPFPEAGIWHNPEQSPGSGLNFEIQQGSLAGFFYGYTIDGKPEWHLVSGPLVRSQSPGVLWELETTFIRVEGGSCIDCEFTPPDSITEAATIRLEFLQKNYLRISIGEVFNQFFVPFIYGTVAEQHFDETPYLLPKYGRDDEVSEVDDLAPFVFIYRPPQGEYSFMWESEIIGISDASKVGSGPNAGRVGYFFLEITAPPIARDVILGWITCELEEESSQPGCIMRAPNGKNYTIPIGFLGDSGFFGEAEDGSTVEGIRLNYD